MSPAGQARRAATCALLPSNEMIAQDSGIEAMKTARAPAKPDEANAVERAKIRDTPMISGHRDPEAHLPIDKPLWE